RNTQAHVEARLTSTIVPAGGQTTVELPQPGEDLFLYIVDGAGHIETSTFRQEYGLYDVVLATPQAEAPVLTAAAKPLNFLSFYLRPFVPVAA
ncbi:MAG: hypothetical protein KDJ52_36245, partial [Anaerolineae bacterium]|nr:hypothetical protein [Anaerolineae bacterium]